MADTVTAVPLEVQRNTSDDTSASSSLEGETVDAGRDSKPIAAAPPFLSMEGSLHVVPSKQYQSNMIQSATGITTSTSTPVISTVAPSNAIHQGKHSTHLGRDNIYYQTVAPSATLNVQRSGQMASAAGASSYGLRQATSSIGLTGTNAYTVGGMNTTTLGESRIVKGEERVIGYNTRVDESQTIILGERVIEHEVRIPKKIVVEDYVEKVIIVPERRVREEMSEEIAKVQEKIIEIAKPVIQEKIVEVPEIEYIDKIVEVPEVVVQEKIREVPKIQIQERIVEIPKIVYQEKIVEVHEVEYREVPVEKVIEVPEINEQVVIKEVPVPQYVDKPVPEYVDVEEAVDVNRNVPIPIEAITALEFKLPKIRPHWKKVDVPLYVPRFVEIPIPLEGIDPIHLHQAEHYAHQVALLGAQTAASLCEVEELARVVKNTDFRSMIGRVDASSAISQAWSSGTLGSTGDFYSLPAGNLKGSALHSNVTAVAGHTISVDSGVKSYGSHTNPHIRHYSHKKSKRSKY